MNKPSYIEERSGLHNAPLIFSLFAGSIGVGALAYSQFGLSAVFGLLVVVLFTYSVAWRAETFPLLFLLYIALFETRMYTEQFSVFPFPFSSRLIPHFLVASFIILFLNKELDPRQTARPVRSKDPVGGIVLLFLLLVAIQALRGLSLHYRPFAIESELQMYALFTSYFLWRILFQWKNKVEWWLIALAMIGVLTAIEFIALIVSVFTDIVSFVVLRFITRQSQVAIAAFPIVLSLFFIFRKPILRIGSSISIMMITIQVFLSQQRIIWLTFVVIVYIFFTLTIFRKGFTGKSLLKWALVSLLLVGILFSLLLLAAWIFGTDIDVLLKRWEQVESLTDASFMMRVYDARNLIEIVGSDWLTGLGIGAELPVIPLSAYFYFIDNSYLTAYLKGGIPFVIMLILVYGAGIVRAFQVYRRTNNDRFQFYAIAIITALSGQMFAGLTTASMIYYRFVFIWMMLIAAAVVLYEQLDTKTEEDRQIDA